MLWTVFGVLVLVGVILWAIAELPLDPLVKQVGRVVVVVLLVLWLLRVFGLWPGGFP